MVTADSSNLDVAWRMALAGASWAVFQAPNNRAMLTSAPRERSGGASGILGSARVFGLTTGASVTALLFHVVPASGTQAALITGATIAVLAAGVSLLRIGTVKPLL
jgi:DHA2 family multidrug resistance protein-like MFS transporter